MDRLLLSENEGSCFHILVTKIGFFYIFVGYLHAVSLFLRLAIRAVVLKISASKLG